MARPSRKQEIQDKVFDGAFKLLSEGGFQQSPMSKLAEMSKVSIGTIYLYFPSKEELIQCLFEDVRQKMELAILGKYNTKAPLRTRFKILFMNICDYYLHNKSHFIFMDQFLLSKYNTEVLDAFSENVSKQFQLAYRDGIKLKELRKVPFETVMALVYGPIVSSFKMHHTGYRKLTKDLIAELEDCVWSSIAR